MSAATIVAAYHHHVIGSYFVAIAEILHTKNKTDADE